MIRSCLFVGVLAIVLLSDDLFASVPNKFYGEWDVHIVTKAGFPWWNQIKYPTKLKISSEKVLLIDQSGFECEVKKITFDAEIDSLVFEHCGIGNKNENAFNIYQVTSIDERGNLEGKVQNYKELFRWVGIQKQ